MKLTGLTSYQQQALAELLECQVGAAHPSSKPCPTVALIAGVATGKTATAIIACAQFAAQFQRKKPGEICQIAWWEPTNLMLTKTLYPYYIPWWQSGAHPLMPGKLNKVDGTYITDNGQTIVRFVSAEKPERAEGFHPALTIANEAGQITGEAAAIMFARQGTGGGPGEMGKLLITTTPYSLNWLKDLCMEPERHNVRLIKAKAIEATHKYTHGDIEALRAKLPPHIFAMRYEAEFARAEGLVFDINDNIVTQLPGTPSWWWWGLDFGYSPDPLAAILLAEGDGWVCAVDEIYRTELTISEIANELETTANRHSINAKTTPIIADHNEARVVEELSRRGFKMILAKKGAGSINAGIAIVQEALKTKRLFVHRRCEHLFRECNNYTYNDKGKPIDKDNHTPDALRYGLYPETGFGKPVAQPDYTPDDTFDFNVIDYDLAF